jgi:hypothetical protein
MRKNKGFDQSKIVEDFWERNEKDLNVESRELEKKSLKK